MEESQDTKKPRTLDEWMEHIRDEDQEKSPWCPKCKKKGQLCSPWPSDGSKCECFEEKA